MCFPLDCRLASYLPLLNSDCAIMKCDAEMSKALVIQIIKVINAINIKSNSYDFAGSICPVTGHTRQEKCVG